MIDAGNAAGREAPVYSLVIPGFNEEAVPPLLVALRKPVLVGGVPINANSPLCPEVGSR
ncbi:hypothetical protein [Mesorhizobium sp. B2-6-2]|uniref:hypothetical protein n=1 Tax=Mesorhizobium sp. B2-6-2 TaxID=2589915 RepID=UPI0015E423F6|nr:hypothetical protein [Mesorhizobium sp. B2-6-2]